MGSATPTVANSLTPYGLVTSLLRQAVPVHVVISQTKGFDGVDFVYNGVSYKGGTFIIPAEFITPAIESGTINAAAWSGVVKVKTLTAFTVNVTYTMKSCPRFVMDAQNGSIAQSYLTAAGITNTAFPGIISFKAPSTLNSCDDVFSMPHADPTFAVHGKLYDWIVNQKGALYMGCHSPSVFEAITAPAINPFGYTPGLKFNMLTTNGLVDFDDHDDATFPLKERLPSDPVGQYMGALTLGVVDNAHDGGSEQIYLPGPGSVWNAGAKILVYDPTHPEVSGGANITNPVSTNAAVVTVYGRAYDNPTAGWVMYQGGHTVGGTGVAEVAAQRKYLNFAMYSQLENAPQITTTIPASPFVVGLPYSMSVNVSSIVASSFTYQWSATCGGTFSNPTGASTTFTPSASSPNCIITCTVTDPCGRKSFTSTATVINSGPQPPVGVADSYAYQNACITPGDFYDLNVLANDTDPENGALTVTAVSGNNGTWTIVGNKVRYEPTVNFGGIASATYTVCDPTSLCATGVPITVNFGTVAPSTLTAVNDAVTINEDAIATINVLANDVLSALSVKLTILSQPANGVAVLNIDNTVTYQPNHDFAGVNTFTYQVCNSEGTCKTATVTVTVTNDACDGSTYQSSAGGAASLTGTATGDNILWEPDGGDDNYGSCDYSDIGGQGSNRARYVSKFTLPTLPSGATVTSATLSMKLERNAAKTQALSLFRLTRAFVEGPGNGACGASANGVPSSWDEATDGVNWTTGGGDFTGNPGTTAYASASVTSSSTTGTSFVWTITNLVNEWYANTYTNHGFLIRGPETNLGSGDNYIFFHSKDAATSTDRPVLTVNYTTAATCAAIPNRAPLAANDNGYTTPSGTPITINVKANDLDYESDAITLRNTFTLTELFGTRTGAAVGTATRTAQQLVFTPAVSFKGTAIIQYRIAATGGTDTDNANAYVVVTNAPPVAGNDADSLVNNAAGTAFTTVNVGANDSDPDGAGLQDPTIVSGPRFGAASFSATTLTYTPAADFVGIDTVQYQVCELADPADCNPNPLCVTATVTITVNNAPRVTNAVTIAKLPCVPRTVNVIQEGVADVGLLPLTLQILTPLVQPQGTLVDNGDGTVTFTPLSGLALPATAIYSWRVQDSDGNLSNTSTLTFQISQPANTAPVAADATEDIQMNQAFPVSLDDYTSDPDGNTLTNPTITILPSNGSISYLPNGLAVYTPNPGYFGTDQITYQVCDLVIDPSDCATSPGLCDLGVITFNIELPNITVAVSDQNTTWSGVATKGNVLTNDFDPTADDEPLVFLGFDVSGTLQTVGTFSVAGVDQLGAPVANAGTLVISADGKYTFTPLSTFSGTVALDYKISDANVNPAFDMAKLIIEVRDIDATANNLIALNDEAVSYQSTITENVLDNDVDPEGNTMTVTGYAYDSDGNGTLDATTALTTAVTIGGTDINGVAVANVGTLALGTDGSYTFVPKADFIGYGTIQYTVCDNGSPIVCKTALLEIVIIPNEAGNDPPFAGDDFAETVGNTPVSSTLFPNDYDPNGNAITATAQNITNQYGTFVLNTDGTYTFTPNGTFYGTAEFPYQICDNGSPVLCASATLYVLIERGQTTYPDVNTTFVNVQVSGDVQTNDLVEAGTTYGNPQADGGNPAGGVLNLNSDGTYFFIAKSR